MQVQCCVVKGKPGVYENIDDDNDNNFHYSRTVTQSAVPVYKGPAIYKVN